MEGRASECLKNSRKLKTGLSQGQGPCKDPPCFGGVQGRWRSVRNQDQVPFAEISWKFQWQATLGPTRTCLGPALGHLSTSPCPATCPGPACWTATLLPLTLRLPTQVWEHTPRESEDLGPGDLQGRMTGHFPTPGPLQSTPSWDPKAGWC